MAQRCVRGGRAPRPQPGAFFSADGDGTLEEGIHSVKAMRTKEWRNGVESAQAAPITSSLRSHGRMRNISEFLEMLNFDVEDFIAKLDGMGMKLTAVPLADGKFRVSRWYMMTANDHAEQIQDLWTRQIGDDQERIDVLAAHLAKLAPNEAPRSVSSSLPHVASPDIATESD